MATQKQKKAVKKTLENGGNVTQGMRDAQYKETTVNNPKNLTKSKGWKELMKEYLPDADLATKHKKFLNSKREEIGVKALDMGYKLKGHYATDKLDIDIKSAGEKLTKQGEVFKTAIKSGLRGRGHSKVDTRKPNSNGDK